MPYSADIIPDRLNDPDRFARVAERHLKAFRWEPQGWIPLGLIVNDPRHSRGIVLRQWMDADVFLELQARILRDTLEVGSVEEGKRLWDIWRSAHEEGIDRGL